MRNLLLAVLLVLGIAAAARPALQAPAPAPAPACDTTELHQLRIKVRFSEDRALHYAAIVARDPSQARFLNGWMRRAFRDVLPAPTP